MDTNSVQRGLLFYFIRGLILKVPPSFLKAFFYALAITFFVFLVEATTFSYSDHDFARLASYGAFCNYTDGRWAADILALLTRIESIPYLCLFWGLVFKVVAGIMAVYFLTNSKDFVILFCGALYAGISPEGLSFVNFKFQSQMFSGAMFWCVLSFLINEKDGLKYFWFVCLSALLAIATYTPVLSLFGVMFFGKILFDLLLGVFKNNIKKYIRMAICVLLAGIAEYVIIKAFIHFHIIVQKYNTSAIAFGDLPKKIVDVVGASFEYFYPFSNAAYMPAEIKIALLVLSVLSLCVVFKAILKQKGFDFRTLLAVCFVIFCVIVSAKAAMILTPVTAYHAYRLNAAGSIFLCILLITALLYFSESKFIQVGSQLLILFVFYSCIVQDGLFQRQNHDQYVADTFFAQRVVSHVESLDGFDINKSYKYIFVGNMPYLSRARYASYNYPYSLEEFRRGLMMPWEPTALLQYVAPYMKVASLNTDLNLGKDTVLTYKVYQYAKKFTWPNDKFVKMLPDDTILVVLDNKDVDLILKKITPVLVDEKVDIDMIGDLQ